MCPLARTSIQRSVPKTGRTIPLLRKQGMRFGYGKYYQILRLTMMHLVYNEPFDRSRVHAGKRIRIGFCHVRLLFTILGNNSPLGRSMSQPVCPDVLVYVCANCIPQAGTLPRQWKHDGAHVWCMKSPAAARWTLSI